MGVSGGKRENASMKGAQSSTSNRRGRGGAHQRNRGERGNGLCKGSKGGKKQGGTLILLKRRVRGYEDWRGEAERQKKNKT